jgi:predicted Zn-dependent protease
MRSRWYSEPAGHLAWLASFALLLGCAGSAVAHPDLATQSEHLDHALNAQPENAELLIRRGDIYRREGKFAAAEQDFAAARLLEPDNPELDFFQGRLLLDMGQPEQADELLSRWTSHHPDQPTAWLLRGDARMQMKQPLAAAEAYTQAIALSERPSPGVYLQQASALHLAGQAYWQQALAAVNSGLEKFPLEVSLLGLGMDIALESARPDLARSYFERVPIAVQALPQWQLRASQLAP